MCVQQTDGPSWKIIKRLFLEKKEQIFWKTVSVAGFESFYKKNDFYNDVWVLYVKVYHAVIEMKVLSKNQNMHSFVIVVVV